LSQRGIDLEVLEGTMKLHMLLFAAALMMPEVALADAAPADNQEDNSGCDFAPPSPMLKAHAYAGQTFVASADHEAVETALMDGGVVLKIYHSQCVDMWTRDFVLTIPSGGDKRDFPAWVDSARDVLRVLKVQHAGETSELIDFLKTARAMTPKEGTVTMCRDGRVEDDCSWDSGGRFSVEVKPGIRATQITVSESISG
jgi:hypothetical protein